MATSRRTGSNENISTYGGGARDYTVLATWEAATDYDLVTATTSEILECYDDSSSFDDYMTMSGATCNASYRRIVRPAAGQGHNGTPNNGFTISSTTDAPVIRVDESYAQVQDLIVSLNINSANNRLVLGGTGTIASFVGCLIVDSNNSGAGIVNGIWFWGGTTKYAINCLVHNITNHGMYLEGLTYGYFYNCTVTSCGNAGFCTATGSAYSHAKNCVPSGNSTNWSGNWTKTTCITDGSTPTYVNAAGDDFHLDDSDTVCRGNGTDLSADALYPFDDDIDFETRSQWDIGFDECHNIFPNDALIDLVSDNATIYGHIVPNSSTIELSSDNANMYGHIVPSDAIILLVSDSPATAHLVIDWSIASTAYKELTTSYTAFIAFQGAYDKQICTLILIQDGTGNRDISLPSNVRDNDDVSLPLSLSTTANYIDYLIMIYRADIDKYDILGFVKGYN